MENDFILKLKFMEIDLENSCIEEIKMNKA